LAPGGDGCIFSYDFNIPYNSFENQSDITTSASFTAHLETNAPSGYPSKNKGIYFDTVDAGCIYVEDVILNHTFSFHMWVRASSIRDMPIFSKYGTITVALSFEGFFGALGNSFGTSSGTYRVDEWEYVAVTVCLESEQTRFDYWMNSQL
jgi:hypothetical protein